ncbi:hypothetical protein DFH09DRAFT_1099088 [Mycena vulgaris]|nr:hypothetical protein DFH09DRAFT_1099088 [Mycena vulgaris]
MTAQNKRSGRGRGRCKKQSRINAAVVNERKVNGTGNRPTSPPPPINRAAHRSRRKQKARRGTRPSRILSRLHAPPPPPTRRRRSTGGGPKLAPRLGLARRRGHAGPMRLCPRGRTRPHAPRNASMPPTPALAGHSQRLNDTAPSHPAPRIPSAPRSDLGSHATQYTRDARAWRGIDTSDLTTPPRVQITGERRTRSADTGNAKGKGSSKKGRKEGRNSKAHERPIVQGKRHKTRSAQYITSNWRGYDHVVRGIGLEGPARGDLPYDLRLRRRLPRRALLAHRALGIGGEHARDLALVVVVVFGFERDGARAGGPTVSLSRERTVWPCFG